MKNKVKLTNFSGLPAGILIPLIFASSCSSGERAPKPNVIIFYIDDMGYSDLGCYGSKINRTPILDRMAAEGMMFTDFYSASSVCTPSRAALLTGCYPIRVDMAINDWETGMKQVLFPVSTKGLNPSETTIADMLKVEGYQTACIGKWHLGDQPEFLPTRQGFDYYYGIPYSNDMGSEQFPINPPLPLLRQETVIEAPVEQSTMTQRFTNEAIAFMEKNKSKPFFIYLPHAMVHFPLHVSDSFKGKSANGIYGDAVEEVDWSLGQVLEYLKENDLDDNTLVLFSSDNGGVQRLGGSNLPLSGSKGSIMEGGFRVPLLARWPGKIPVGSTSNSLTSTIDILPTLAEVCGAELPHVPIDGVSIAEILYGKKTDDAHSVFLYYQKNQLQAIRSGTWKLVLPLDNRIVYPWSDSTSLQEALLFKLSDDIAEEINLAETWPQRVTELIALADSAKSVLGDGTLSGKEARKAGFVSHAEPLRP